MERNEMEKRLSSESEDYIIDKKDNVYRFVMRSKNDGNVDNEFVLDVKKAKFRQTLRNGKPVTRFLDPVKDNVLVSDMNFGERMTKSGIILKTDDGKNHGIRPRWGKIYAVGDKNKDDYRVGDWILIEHGRWSRGIKFNESTESAITLRLVDADAILGYQEEKPEDETVGEGI